jgi:hypothetical protein
VNFQRVRREKLIYQKLKRRFSYTETEVKRVINLPLKKIVADRAMGKGEVRKRDIHCIHSMSRPEKPELSSRGKDWRKGRQGGGIFVPFQIPLTLWDEINK